MLFSPLTENWPTHLPLIEFSIRFLLLNEPFPNFIKMLFEIQNVLGRRHKSKSGGTVKGTFDDLSDDEKTKAFLQLLEYKLRMEKEQRTEKKEKERKENSFHELWQRLPTHQIDPVR